MQLKEDAILLNKEMLNLSPHDQGVQLSKSKSKRIINFKSIALYLIVSLFLIFEMAIQVSPSVMSTQLMHDLNVDTYRLGLMSGIYFFSYTLMQIPSGLILDKYSPRLIISLSLLICAFGTFLFALSENIYQASIARLLMGSGSAFAFVSVLVVTIDLFQAKYFATITGITQMLAAFGAMIGQFPIALLISDFGWRKAMMLLSWGAVILALIIYNVLQYRNITVGSPQIKVAPSSIKNNLIQVMLKPQTWIIALYASLLWAPMSGFASLWGVPFLMTVDQLNQHTAALICSSMWLGLALASPMLGVVSAYIKNKIILFSLIAFVGACSFYLTYTYCFSSSTLAILLFFAGAACAGQALSFSLVKENNRDGNKATAIAFNNMAVVVSGAIFQPIIGKLINYNHNNLALISAPDYKRGLSIILLAFLLAAIIPILFFQNSIKNNNNI